MREETSTQSDERPAARAWPAPLLVVVLVAAVWVACFCLPRVWTATGIAEEGRKVFLDLDGLLASGEAAQQGLDPFQPNPLDVYHRPHVYTAWWLVTGKIGLTRADSRWLGPLLAGAMLISAVWLVRPGTRREAMLLVLVLVSPAILMAVNRGNNDLVAFVVMCGAFALLRREGSPPRIFGVALLAAAAVLKYYPLAAAVVLLDARSRREWLGWVLVYGLVVLVAWPALVPGLHSAAKYRPSPEWLYAFGAPVVFRDFSLATPPSWLLLGAGLAVAAWAARGAWSGQAGVTAASAAEREFAGGAAVVVGCFALGSSYTYKLVFAVWLLPWLWRATPAGPEDCWRKATLGLLLAVLWLEGLMGLGINLLVAPANAGWAWQMLRATLLISQLLEWALVICLLRSLLIYMVRRSARLVGGVG